LSEFSSAVARVLRRFDRSTRHPVSVDDDDELPPQAPNDLTDATPEELAAFGLRKDIAALCDELHYAVEEGLNSDTLHDIVGLWEANNSDLTFDGLVEWGRPCSCDECGTDVTPYDEDGRLIEGASEWYMVTSDVWKAAAGLDGPAQYLCISCLEKRSGRLLRPDDFPDIGINEPSWLDTHRLHALLTDRAQNTGQAEG
jgi:hypothetical protein